MNARHDFKACSDVNLRVGEFGTSVWCWNLFFFMFLKLPHKYYDSNTGTRLIRREFDITTSLSSSNGRRVFGAVSLSRCFDVSESDVLSSCKSAVIKSFDQSDVLQSVNVDTRQVVGDSMTARYRIHLFVEGRTRPGHQFLNLVYFLIFMSCCT